MEINNLQKPCLFQTAQGFSVSYNNKFLYSKYNPKKAILQNISNLSILPGTLILLYSPVLPYGINELLNKLPEKCFVLAVEYDDALRLFQNEIITKNHEIAEQWNKIILDSRFSFTSKKEILNLPFIINKQYYSFESGIKLFPAGSFKRILRIDSSAGIQFHTDFYNELQEACTNSIMTFWSNRITLTKFGRNYSSNFFKNLKLLPQTKPIENYINQITKNIIVFGAGQSTDSGIKEIIAKRDDFYILCVDTVLLSLLKYGIIPDGVFIEEAQFVITKAFIGALQNDIHIFAGLSSISQLAHIFKPEQISFFTTLYADTQFISVLNKTGLLPPCNNPFGSVGLTAVYYALRFRKNTSIPIFIYGLDFSYSAGYTHTKGAMAHISQLLTTNRLKTVQNYNAAFSDNSILFSDKKGNKFITTHILNKYAVIFNSIFADEINLFDAGDCGIKLNIPQKKPFSINNTDFCEDNIDYKYINTNFNHLEQKISSYFTREYEELIKLKNILTGQINLEKSEAETEIKKIAIPREYLYLHFPDGWQFSLDLSFLKRLRVEIDYFLKIFSN